VTLTPESVRRAGIELGLVTSAATDVRLRVPGEVQPNAYRIVAVTPLVAGRITDVSAELGAPVLQGQRMARIYSPELARAQTEFLASQAELLAHEQRLRRTERLVEIGAASQQELEQAHAEHTMMTTRVASGRSTLELLGLSSDRIADLASSGVSSVVDVPAPIAGVVTERRANVGLNVDPSMALFTVVDLSTVWVVADVYEHDFAAVRTGSSATVTAAAYPGFRFDGRVSYIDPQVRNDTRTAKLRVEVPNRDGRLRLGMYVDVSLLETSRAQTAVVPVAALQPMGDRYVVYVPGAANGTFVERGVKIGQRSGDVVQVESGLAPGEQVVIEGAFFLRAERERTSPGGVAP
jgi:RND family efflux transporter MFP subunit